MDCVSPLIEPILSLVLNPLTRHIGYLIKARKNVQNMTNQLEELTACRNDIQKEIEDVERRQKQSIDEVNLWLERVKKVKDQVVATKNKYENRGCRLFGDSSLNYWLAYKYSKRAIKLLEEMVQLETKRKDFTAIARVQSPGHVRPIPTESTLLGIDRYVEMVRNHLIDDTVGVIGIYGMGGVGKMTLLDKVYNSLAEGDILGFKYLIRVVVSQEFQLKKLQAQVAKSLGLTTLDDTNDAYERSRIIFDYLVDKSFLLLLDDVWKRVNLLDVGIPDIRCNTSSNNQTKKMQKVILTTRLEKVCGEMGASETIKVECLSKEDAKALFMKTLGERNLESNLGIHGLVEEVVDECAGLPLALTVIARAMATKKTIPEWHVAIRALKRSYANEILDDDSIMFSTLKFSYDSLKSNALRSCFLYCSLWPEDCDILELNLIAFCIETELIKDFDSMSDAYDKGHWLIEDLKKACLLEDSVGYLNVKMYDVIRDLALWMVSDCGVNQNKWLVKSGIGLREAPIGAEKWKETHVVSLMYNEIEELPFVPFECPSLSFLLLRGNFSLSKIHPGFFQNMRALTYLDLSSTTIRELPESITVLTRLRCLNLESTFELEYIPSGMISSLQELRVLNIFYSKICRFLEDCVGGARKGSRMSSREKSLMDELECLVAEGGLKGLSISVWSIDAFQRLSMLSHTVSISRLHLRELQGVHHTLQLQHNIWRSLQQLRLDDCVDVEVVEFVVDAERKSETSCPIEKLEISGLYQLKEMILWRGVSPSAVFFHKLRDVFIEGCFGLKSISWVLELPSLVCLSLWYCVELECLVDEHVEEQDRTAVAFPTLKRLQLRVLPKLSHICGPQYGLPALQHLEVTRCPKLKKFPFPSNNNKMKRIKCQRRWWEGLEWDDEGIKASMESIPRTFYYE